jgi:hypothetical protein
MNQQRNEALIGALQIQRRSISELRELRYGNPQLTGWRSRTTATLERVGIAEFVNTFKKIHYTLTAFSSSTPDSRFQESYIRGLDRAQGLLDEVIDYLQMFPELLEAPVLQAENSAPQQQIIIQLTQVATQVTQTTSIIDIMNLPQFAALPSNQRNEMETQIHTLNDELAKANPSWDVVKRILLWAINFGRDVFLQILPYIFAKATNLT